MLMWSYFSVAIAHVTFCVMWWNYVIKLAKNLIKIGDEKATRQNFFFDKSGVYLSILLKLNKEYQIELNYFFILKNGKCEDQEVNLDVSKSIFIFRLTF